MAAKPEGPLQKKLDSWFKTTVMTNLDNIKKNQDTRQPTCKAQVGQSVKALCSAHLVSRGRARDLESSVGK